MKYNAYLLVFCMLLLSSCFKDKGNYDYTDINDITIGDKGLQPIRFTMYGQM